MSILHPELEDQMLRFFLRLATTESWLDVLMRNLEADLARCAPIALPIDGHAYHRRRKARRRRA